MNDALIHLQPAYVLHSRKYRETSLIVEMLTRDFGKVMVLAKGVRKSKSKTAGLLQPFISLNISLFGKNELKTLTDVELNPPLLSMVGMPLYCGFYINDLVKHLLYIYDPHPQVYFDYRLCLSQLAQYQSLDKALRLFEISLLENIGYALELRYDYVHGHPVAANKRYDYHAENGPCENPEGPFSGEMLIALNNRNLHSSSILIEAKKLLRSVINYHLPDKPLNSRILISQHQKYFKTRSNE